MGNLTEIEHWNHGYDTRREINDLTFDWRNRAAYLIAMKIESVGLDGKSILEIGAGDSQWLPYFAKRFPSARFAGLDYSAKGCERLAARAAAIEPAKISIHNQDMFSAESKLHGKFDLVMSFGVVEHFTSLAQVLLAKQRYLKNQGLMFSLIPNMAGSMGYLTKLFNKEVYRMHNPHDWHSFLQGHREAGLDVISGGYLGSVNVGVISGCFDEQKGLPWHTYVFLTRLGNIVALAENKVGDLPASKCFSPYIYAISKAK